MSAEMHRAAGYEGLGFAVAEQAILDYRGLRERGWVSGLKVIRLGPFTHYSSYDSMAQVQELLYWINEHMDDWLEMLGSELEGRTIKRMLAKEDRVWVGINSLQPRLSKLHAKIASKRMRKRSLAKIGEKLNPRLTAEEVQTIVARVAWGLKKQGVSDEDLMAVGLVRGGVILALSTQG